MRNEITSRTRPLSDAVIDPMIHEWQKGQAIWDLPTKTFIVPTLPRRCKCCSPNSRRMIWGRNNAGRYAVCPTTRVGYIILHGSNIMVSHSLFIGNLDGD